MDYNAYVLLQKQTFPKFPLISDKGKKNKIIKWVPLFEDAISRTFVSECPLVYIVQENAKIPDVGYDPLTENAHCGASEYMLKELIHSLPHVGPIFRDDNKNVFMMISLMGNLWSRQSNPA